MVREIQDLRQSSDSLLWVSSSLANMREASLKECLAPAQDVLEYEVVKFHSGPLNAEEDDIYSMPPSSEVDEAWRSLYKRS